MPSIWFYYSATNRFAILDRDIVKMYTKKDLSQENLMDNNLNINKEQNERKNMVILTSHECGRV